MFLNATNGQYIHGTNQYAEQYFHLYGVKEKMDLQVYMTHNIPTSHNQRQQL